MTTLQYIGLVIFWFAVGCIISALGGCATTELTLTSTEINDLTSMSSAFYK